MKVVLRACGPALVLTLALGASCSGGSEDSMPTFGGGFETRAECLKGQVKLDPKIQTEELAVLCEVSWDEAYAAFAARLCEVILEGLHAAKRGDSEQAAQRLDDAFYLAIQVGSPWNQWVPLPSLVRPGSLEAEFGRLAAACESIPPPPTTAPIF